MDNSKITPGWLKEKFGWAVSQQDSVHFLELADGLMGRIYRIECAGHGFVYKIPPKGNSGWQQIFREAGLMDREIQAYNFLYKNFPGIAKTLAPAYYWAEKESAEGGALAIEDLTDSAIKVPFANGLSYDQAESSVRSLARLHSVSVTREKNPLVAPDDWIYTAQSEDLIEAIHEGIRNVPSLMTDRLPGLLSPVALDQLLTLNIKETALNAHRHSKIVSCCHGDTWSSNILFKKSENIEEDGRALLIDWQFFMWGNPLTDVALLLMSSVDIEKRHQWTETLLQAYCSELNQYSNIRYSLHDCYEDYRLAKNYAVIVMFSSLETYTNSMRLSEYLKLYPRIKGAIEEFVMLKEYLQQNMSQIKHENI